MADTTPAIALPARGERAAPKFDNSKPRELPRFFEDLEFLFGRAKITDESEKKRQLLRYVDFELEQIWKTFPEFDDPQKTYEDFKAAILVHYPDASGDFIYSIRDMDLLIGERQRIGITTAKDLSDYHLQFVAITRWLIIKQHLSELEQQRAYTRAFQPQLLGLINNRLSLKEPDHHPNIPYKVEKVYEAARFILQGASPVGYVSSIGNTAPTTSPISTGDTVIKTENLSTIFTEFAKTIAEVLQQNNNREPPPRSSRPYNNNNNNQNFDCSYCGGSHFIRECPVVSDDVKAGKCKRNHEGKVVLPTGAFVPREIQGRNLRDRIDEWHKRHPNQLATLIHTVDMRHVLNHQNGSIATRPDTNNFQLSTHDRIATLEAELFNLRARKPAFEPIIRTRNQKTRDTRAEIDDEEEVAEARKRRQPTVEEEEEPRTQERQPTRQPTPTASIPTRQPEEAPEHPYRQARDAAYTPPTNRNVGAQDKNVKKTEPAYKTLPPVHDPEIAARVYKRSMEAPITITQRELLSLSPEVRSQVRECTTTRRIQNKDAAQNLLQEGEDEDDDDYSTTVPTLAVTHALHRTPPEGAIVVPDPIETYYKSLPPGQHPDPDKLIVAMESCAVRSIFALVDNSQKRECILDPGCQIIAMSETTSHDLGLAYDPSIRLNMQSANGNIDQSLGLSRNVPFQISNITFYLQVHVIRSPAYDILLGRPFDTLTESIIRNFANEDQTITISDPNTGRRITVPTLPRSHKGFRGTCPHHKKQDF